MSLDLIPFGFPCHAMQARGFFVLVYRARLSLSSPFPRSPFVLLLLCGFLVGLPSVRSLPLCACFHVINPFCVVRTINETCIVCTNQIHLSPWKKENEKKK